MEKTDLEVLKPKIIIDFLEENINAGNADAKLAYGIQSMLESSIHLFNELEKKKIVDLSQRVLNELIEAKKMNDETTVLAYGGIITMVKI